MNFESFDDFLHMGGYAFYVWTSYALALVILVANVLLPLFRQRRQLDELANSTAREARRKR